MAEVGIRLAQDLGVRKLNLSVRADNQRALRLYRSLGFEAEGRTARALRVGGRFFAEVNMGLCLDLPARKNKRPDGNR
jgi:RimJ/RimL family protein N-acetyltransferase